MLKQINVQMRATSFLDFTGLVVSPVALVSVGLVVLSGSVRAVSFVELMVPLVALVSAASKVPPGSV